MSHRPEDVFEYRAITDIMSGTVCAFKAGDPVPAETVEALGLLDSEQVAHREDYEPPSGDEAPAVALRRGEMPPHLRDQTPADTDTGSSRTKTATAAKSTGGTKTASKAAE